MPERTPAPGEIYLYVDTTRRSDTDRELHNQYGLSVAAPWKDGGSLFINFPEHLEYNPEGRSILRHWDAGPLPWVISPDGRQASYRVESPHLEGVIVEAFARVAGPAEVPAGTKGVYLAMRITNGSGSALPGGARSQVLVLAEWRVKVGGRYHGMVRTSTGHSAGCLSVAFLLQEARDVVHVLVLGALADGIVESQRFDVPIDKQVVGPVAVAFLGD